MKGSQRAEPEGLANEVEGSQRAVPEGPAKGSWRPFHGKTGLKSEVLHSAEGPKKGWQVPNDTVPDITMHKDESITMVPDERMMLASKPRRGPGQQSPGMSASAAAAGIASACSASDPCRAI